MEEHQQNVPHRRYNPLNRSWILCSPHRAKRPWLGQLEKPAYGNLPSYDPTCYLCPNNKRSGDSSGAETPTNPAYTGTFVFTNDFSALLPPGDQVQESHEDPLFTAQEASGKCKVICFSPKHDVTLPVMTVPEIEEVVRTWTEEYQKIGSEKDINYVQIFENKGITMGCSNPHPHCQIWASSFIPEEPQSEIDAMREYLQKNKSCMLCDYTKKELDKKVRVVCENDSFVVVVPYWALWPYETLVLSKKHIGNLTEFDKKQASDYADIIKRISIKFDNLFQCSFPYSSGIHQTPTDGQEHKECHFHMHYFPPLLRSSTVRKFMVGYEMLGEPQRDITAEQSAARLRELSDTVYFAHAQK
eukprot:TRINITY_DN22102_c0_g1_i1.p1 TRINITY_DN22102_c0_g1~~TRINITY_DN22102_c0_g1_i1.p1  ORF type:complete len:367 (-),score=69.69 TRINITY_DN22102_c0_g1_i1:153-1226(-)